MSNEIAPRLNAALAGRDRVECEIALRTGPAILAASSSPATGEVGTPPVLSSRNDAGTAGTTRAVGYDVSPGGTHVFAGSPIDRPDALPTTVVPNWLDELKARMQR